ncbi:TonB family protein [Acidobacteriota bacterium]
MRKLKILIVDFDEEASRYLSEFLKAEGFDVSEAPDGEIGLEKCKAEMPDLVVVEPMISKLHGFELCSIITNDFNGKIPVVILTKFYREEQFKIEAMRSYGAAAFLSKPFKGPDILETIRDLLKEKIKEDEEEEMAEDMQALDEIADKDLEKLEIDVPATKSKEPVEEFEKEIRESLATPQKEAEPQTETVNASKIDKMLEDTLSEFGLNVDKKEKPKAEDKMEFQAKMDALVEELKSGKKGEDTETLEPKAKKPAVKELEIKPDIKSEITKEEKKDLKAEELKITETEIEEKEKEVEEVDTKEPEVKEPGDVAPEVKEPEETTLEVPDVTEEIKEDPAGEIKEEKTIFAAETEEKGSILQTLKNSLPFIKKHPLKLLIPGALIAAIAVSASFVFRKPSNPNPTTKQTTAVMQQAKSQEMTPPEEIVIESPSKEEESKPASTVKEEAKEPVEEAKSTNQETQEGTVKARVSQVFKVEEAKAKPKPDLNSIDVAEDVMSTDPSEEIAAPILSEPEPVQIPEDNTGDSSSSSADMTAQNLTQEESSIPTQEEADNPPEPGKPKTKLGDLVPMSEVDVPPEIAKRVEPKYPTYALSRGVGGKVIFNVLIGENGDVIEAALLRGINGPYGFNEESEKAIRQWKFVPAFKDGIKVKVWKTVSFTFKKT